MSEIFNRLAEHYDTPERKKLASIIEKQVTLYLQDSRQKTFLDYGGGTGLVSLPLAPLVKELVIWDSSAAMIDAAKEKISTNHIENAHAEVCDLMAEQPADTASDIVLLSLVLLHIPDTQKIISRIYQLLKPGGQLMIVDFTKTASVSHPLVHNGFSKEELVEAAKKAGFKETSFQPFYKGKNIFMKQDAEVFLFQAVK